MERRKLGTLEVSAIGLGCMPMSGWYGERDEKGALVAIDRALEIGVDLLDTADVYANGHNETLVGRALKGRFDRVVLATKFGNEIRPGSPLRVRGDAPYVAKACERSLKRLGTDVIDLYFVHRIDVRVPIEDTVGAMSRLIEAGKVRHIGLSEAGPETIRRAHAIHPLTAIQTEYSLWSRDAEAEILPICRQLGIGFVAYSPLGRGFLTGAFKTPDALRLDDIRRLHPRFAAKNMSANMHLLDGLSTIAGRHESTIAQVALAWLLGRGKDVVPIPGTKNAHWLEENACAATLKLPETDREFLNQLFAHGAVAGERFPPEDMARVNL